MFDMIVSLHISALASLISNSQTDDIENVSQYNNGEDISWSKVGKYPNRYEWECCGENGLAEGCKKSRHSTGL